MLKNMWEQLVNFFNDNIWNIILFFAVLVIGGIFVKLVINIFRRILKKSRIENIAQRILVTAIKVALYLVLILTLLSIIGVQISGLVTAISAAILAIGVALQNIIANVANGIVIVSSKMFKIGDWVSVDGVSGSVTDINLIFTTLTTADNQKVMVPNSTITSSSTINTGANPKRRVEFVFSVAYETDVELVKKVVTDVMKSNGKVYLDPAPFCRLKVLGANSLDFNCNCWCDKEDYWDVYYYIVENVYNEFKRNNISIPYAQLEVRQRTDVVKMPVIKEQLPDRVEKVREEHLTIDLETASISDVIQYNKKLKEKHKQERKAKKTKKSYKQ